jgi:hypothetical protein
MPQRSRISVSTPIKRRPTKLQRQERRNERKNLQPPAGVQIVQPSRQSQKSKALNDILDQLQDLVPSFSASSKLNKDPDVSLCLQCIPDAKARKYLEKYGDNINWDEPCDSDASDYDE